MPELRRIIGYEVMLFSRSVGIIADGLRPQ